MIRRLQHQLLAAICLLTSISLGCIGNVEGPPRVEVTGQVTWNGEPLSSGKLMLIPTEETEAPPSGATIENGSYRVTNKGGVVPGTYRVEITAERPKPGVPVTDPDFPPTEQYIPAQYNTASTLTMTVPADSPTYQQDFDLSE